MVCRAAIQVKSNYTIKDNFLSDDEFSSIRELLMGDWFPWFYNVGRVNIVDGDYQLTHTFYRDNLVKSDWFNYMNPILEKLNLVSLLRIKANLSPRENENVLCEFHQDGSHIRQVQDGDKNWFVSIFYINTNDGYTALEDGTKIKSVENRLLTFPASVSHAGATCTDENVRVLINLNYIT